MRCGDGAGAVPFGMFALNALRVEKGYRAWKGDLSTDYTLLQGGLDRFIDWGKDFPGRAALLAEKQAGVAKRFVALTVAAGDCDPPYMSTIWHRGAVVGEVTSAAWGHRVGACVALGMLRADLTAVKGRRWRSRSSATATPRSSGATARSGTEERTAAGMTGMSPDLTVICGREPHS
jgi:glycine cleavage system aminomethyltransferase T